MLGKGSLYIRPLLVVSRAVLGLAAAPEYTFLIYVSPFGNCFKVLKAQSVARTKGFSDVLSLDCVHEKYVEVSSCNIFICEEMIMATCRSKNDPWQWMNCMMLLKSSALEQLWLFHLWVPSLTWIKGCLREKMVLVMSQNDYTPRLPDYRWVL